MSNNYLIAGTDPLQLIDYCLGELAKFSQGMLSRLSERSFIIVPEALKADIERRYLENYDVNGLMLAEVLSFNRLAHRIFSIAGGLSRDSISTLGKTLIIQRLIYEHGDKFKRFQRFAGKPGYTRELETILSDFKRFDFDNQSLRELVELTPPSLTKDKLSDFAELQKLYADKLEKLNLLDQDDNLDYLADLLERAIINKESGSSASSGDGLNQDLYFLSETRIWITGFADIRSFTQQELKIIKLLSQTVKELKITVCTDLSSQERLRRELFEPGYRSYMQLEEILPTTELIVLPSKISAIQRALQNSFLTGSLAKNSEEQRARRMKNDHERLESPRITLLAADDRRQEWSFIAGEIKRLLKEENIRKKDIGIAICDNIQDLSLEKSTFREFALDTFLSERLPTRQTPLFRYLAGFFNLANQNFSLAELISFFRSGLAEPTQDEIDTFENICLEYGIKFASQIQSDKAYQRIQDDQQKTVALNFKNVYLNPVLSSSKKLHSLRHGREKAKFLLQWLARDSFKNNLQAKITDLRHWGEEDMALSLARSWEIVLQLLEESMVLLADSRISQKGFSEIILGALSGQIPSSIPVGLDRIRVGTMREMMYYDCKILFIAGTSQNTFPPAKSSEGFLHNRELEWIEAKSGKSLPDYRKNQLMAGQVSSILLLSGDKEKIYLTTPYIDKEEWSSVFILLRKELEEKTDFARQASLSSFILGDKLQPDQRWLTRQRTQRYLKASLQAKKNLKDQKINQTEYLSLLDPKKQKDHLPQSKTYWYQAINNLLESNGEFVFLEDEFQDPLDQIKPYIYLDKILNNNILSNKQYVSASSLENFQACPYQYFNNYTLRLRERPVWDVDPRDRGTLIHSMMELALVDLKLELQLSKNKAEEEIIFNNWLSKIKQMNFHNDLYERSILATGINSYEDKIIMAQQGRRIKRHIRTALYFNIKKMSEEDFQPILFEWKFPPAENNKLNYKELELTEKGQGIALRGIIDRIDQSPSLEYRLYDYKTGNKKIDIDRIYQGLDLQLGLYQKVWQLNHSQLSADSIGYLLFNNSLEHDKDSLIPPDKYLSTRIEKHSKLFDVIRAKNEEIIAIGSHAEKKAKEAVREIKRGNISPIPKALKIENLPCQYCRYKEMCRFDNRLISQRANILYPMQIPEKIEEAKNVEGNTVEETSQPQTRNAKKAEVLIELTEMYKDKDEQNRLD